MDQERQISCPRCEGAGQVTVVVLYGERYGIYDAPCLGCKGTGQVGEEEAVRLSLEKSVALADMAEAMGRVRRLLNRPGLVKPRTLEVVVASVKL